MLIRHGDAGYSLVLVDVRDVSGGAMPRCLLRSNVVVFFEANLLGFVLVFTSKVLFQEKEVTENE